MTRLARTLLAIPVLAFAASCGSGAGGGGARPNVLLITLDTVRADYVSAYGDRGEGTPNLDALAESGVRFERALSASAVTPVSHATILTGRFPYRHGLRVLSGDSGFRLGDDQPYLATSFAQAGYKTGAVHSAFPVSSYFGFERDFEHFDSIDGQMAKDAGSATWDVDQLQRRSDDTTDAALAFIDQAGDEPWFLWIHYWDPHDPMLLPPDEFMADLPSGPNGPTTEALYARELRYQDGEIGRLVAGLRKRGLWDDAVIALTADHGEGLSDGLERHGWAHHRILYQEQIHVPLLVRAPGVPVGRRVPELVRTADVAPTLLDYAGLTPSHELDGRSLRPLIEGSEDEPRIAYADQINAYDQNARMVRRRPAAAFLYSLTDFPWKLIWRPHMPGTIELYHLEDDPEERTNLAASQPKHVARLLDELARRNPWVTSAFPSTGEGTSTDARATLEALGYSGGDGVDGDLEWRWVCSRHPKVREESRGRCEKCQGILIPITDW